MKTPDNKESLHRNISFAIGLNKSSLFSIYEVNFPFSKRAPMKCEKFVAFYVFLRWNRKRRNLTAVIKFNRLLWDSTNFCKQLTRLTEARFSHKSNKMKTQLVDLADSTSTIFSSLILVKTWSHQIIFWRRPETNRFSFNVDDRLICHFRFSFHHTVKGKTWIASIFISKRNWNERGETSKMYTMKMHD